MPPDRLRAIVFDVFGTVVDWRTSVAAEARETAAGLGIGDFDGGAFAEAWRAGYQPAMAAVRDGRRPWTPLDVLHRERLDEIAPGFGLDALDDRARDAFTRAWYRLDPWPDSVAGLTRLKRGYVIGTLSNGGVLLLASMAKRAGLPWDCILSSDLFRAYKPQPETYLGALELLGGGEPGSVMLLAAHNDDLAHARRHGLATAFVPRPTEYGPDQTRDLAAEQDWDLVGDSIEDIAEQLGL